MVFVTAAWYVWKGETMNCEAYETGNLCDCVLQAVQQDAAVSGFVFEQQETLLEAERLELKQCLLKQVIVRESKLARPDWSEVVLEDCDLSGAVLRDGSLYRVTLRRCKLVGTDLSGTFLREVTFEDCVCRYANLSFGQWWNVVMQGCDFSQASLDQVKHKHWKMTDCNLRQANLLQTALEKIDLSTSEINGIILQGEELRGAVVSEWQASELLRFLGVSIKES